MSEEEKENRKWGNKRRGKKRRRASIRWTRIEEDRDREEEQVLDDEGNPIPNAPPKPPQNPLKFDMLKQNIKKLLKLLMAFLTLLLN